MNLMTRENPDPPASTRVLVLTACGVFLLSGCTTSGPPAEGAGDWVGSITTEGAVTTTINESGSIWGDGARLVEEMSIGVDVGEDEYMLGRIGSIAVTDNVVVLADTQTPSVRMYDTDGRYLRAIGTGPGQGPGEYQAPVLVAADPDGTVFVFDPNGRRLTAFDEHGEVLEDWEVQDAACCAWRMALAPDGTLWLPVRQWAFQSPTGDTRFGMRAYPPADASMDEVEWFPELEFETATVTADDRQLEVPFSPGYAWALTADGGVTIGTSDQYQFETRRPDGSSLVVQRRVDTVPVDPAEAEWRSRWMLENILNYVDSEFSGSVAIPDQKPAFIGFAPDSLGGTWVWRQGASRHLTGDCVDDPRDQDLGYSRDNSCWVEDRYFDIFSPEGKYLGSVPQPDGIARWNAQLNVYPMGDIVYAVVETAEGVPTVKRYRLEHGDGT
ncbi:MAG: 6-bladed beta-propeller [Acidobacteria bacterium]|nr:6-bladed beta-propeller [Acidobacteriota bacterium]